MIEKGVSKKKKTHEETEFNNSRLSFYYRLAVVEKCLEKYLTYMYMYVCIYIYIYITNFRYLHNFFMAKDM